MCGEREKYTRMDRSSCCAYSQEWSKIVRILEACLINSTYEKLSKLLLNRLKKSKTSNRRPLRRSRDR